MDTQLIKCKLHYFCREKYFNQMLKLAQIAVSESSDPVYQFYSGIALILQGQNQDGIGDLSSLEMHHELLVPVIIATIYAHKKTASIDKEAVVNLENKLKIERKQANNVSLYYSALFLSLAEKYDKASDYLSRSLKKEPNNIDAVILNAWNNLMMKFNNLDTSIADNFEWIVNKSSTNIEALLGWAKCEYYLQRFDASNLLLDKIIVRHPDQVVPLEEKMRNEFALKKWYAVCDTIENILAMNENNIEALKCRIFISLGKNGDTIEASDLLNQLFSGLENSEPNNGVQFYLSAKLFSRICDHSSSVLIQVYKLAQYASELYPNNVEYLSEVGQQCILQGKIKEAQGFFKAASKIDSNSLAALCGLTVCHLAENGPTKQVQEQLELLMEIQGTRKVPILYFLSAKIFSNDTKTSVSYLNQTIDLIISQAAKHPYSLQYVTELDPGFLLEVYAEFKQHLPKKPNVITGSLLYNEDSSDKNVKKCLNMLELIVDACPGILTASFELAKLKFVFGFASESQVLIGRIIDFDSGHAGAHILLAQIYLQKKMFSKASQYLDFCISYNFKIRDNPMYHLVKGVVSKMLENTEEAIKSLKSCLDIVKSQRTNNITKRSETVNIVDKATLYIELIQLYSDFGMKGEAEKLMQEALQEFAYTTENSRLTILKAEQALKSNDADLALELLMEIKSDDSYFFQAKTKMASIYLKVKSNKSMFKNCFRDIVSNTSNADSQSIMGDAYMDINEPEYAAECYTNALKINPKNVQLVRKVGLALMKTHQFSMLISNYEKAIELLPDNEEIKIEYYETLIKLKQYEKVDKLLSNELNKAVYKTKDLVTMQSRVKLLLLQIKARELIINGGNIHVLLNEAREVQTSVVRQIEIDAKGDLQDERQRLSQILSTVATLRSTRDPIRVYTEALANVPQDTKILMSLARLYAEANNAEKCEQTCSVLLNADPNNESAAVMIADLAFRKVDFETAQRHLENILAGNPTSWDALSQLIEVAYRRGKLNEVENHLETAKNASPKNPPPGYWYAAGLFALYSHKPNSALRQFNAARNDEKYKARASKVMCLTCLTHADDDSAIAQEFIAQEGDINDTRTLAIKTAERLLADLPSQDRKPLFALLRLASEHRSFAESIVQDLSGSEWSDEPYAFLALAYAFNQLKQPARTKAILKKAYTDISWTPEKADGLERCWLELADIYSGSSSKIESVKEVINKILKHNVACVAAHRIAGQVAEKEQNYKMAVTCYENAWIHGSRQDLSLGYKYAQVSLKLRRYPQAIAVCRHILKERPDYPKIKKEILDKAVANLKT